MSEDIKEILDKAKEISDYGADGKQHTRMFNQFEAKALLDYITNLKEENEELKAELQEANDSATWWSNRFKAVERDNRNYKSRNEKAIENAKEKIKRYESYINDLKNGNYPSPTVRQERQELIFRIREQEDLLNILQGSDKE